MALSRGEIWWADFGVPFGSEPGYRRPVVIVQSDPFNHSAIQTTIVVPLSTNAALAEAPGNVLCRSRATGLRRLSVANVSQLAVIDRRRLAEKVGSLPGDLLERIEAGIRLALGL